MDVDDRLREHDLAIADIQSWRNTIMPIADQRGVDVEALKLSDAESRTKQRLTFAVGTLLGSLLLTLLAFIATRGG